MIFICKNVSMNYYRAQENDEWIYLGLMVP